MFTLSSRAIDPAEWAAKVDDPAAGALVVFEGRVRNHAEGRPVRGLTYEAYETLAVKEGERVLAEARDRFVIRQAACVHRVGDLGIGDCAVWLGVTAAHRAAAFAACRYIIDEIKLRVPVWKKEHFVEGGSEWVRCHACAEAGHP